MKIIDVLNMIANKDKNLPKCIKIDGDIFRLDWHPGEGFFEGPVYYGASGFCLGARHSLDISLNDEVEILDKIEENKIPEKIPEDLFEDYTKTAKIYQLYKSINEIIDYLKSKGE